MKSHLSALVRILVVGCAFVLPAFAQQNPNLEQGLKPFGTYQGGNLDSISITNRNLTLHIPIVSYPQRGGKLRLNFMGIYNNKSWAVEEYVSQGQTYKRWIWKGAGVQIVNDQSIGVKGTILRMKNAYGDTVLINLRDAITADGSSHQLESANGGMESVDSSGIWWLSGSPVIDRDGTRYGGSTNAIEDSNGNKITINTASGWTDTLGRFLASSVPTDASYGIYPWKNGTMVPGGVTGDYSNCPAGTVAARIWNLPGPNGGTSPIKLCYASYSLQPSFGIPGIQEPGPVTDRFLSAIVLPNLTSWFFQYNGFGDLTQVTLPTGGKISYVWNTANICSSSLQFTSRVVTGRTLDANDGTGPKTWNYPAPGAVTDPLGNDTLSVLSDLDGACSYYVTETRSYQGSSTSGTLLKTVSTSYSWISNPRIIYTDAPAIKVVATTSTTTWPDGQKSQSTTTYDSGNTFVFYDAINDIWTNYPLVYGSVMQTTESDYGNPNPGPVLRQTINTYLWTSDSNYKTRNMLNLVSSTTIKDGAGTQVAQTNTYFDEASRPPQDSGIATQHNVPPSGGTYRGNPTSSCRWLNTTGTCLTSTALFYDTGTVNVSTDPGSHPTTFLYSSSFAGAYVTQVTNALGQATWFNYDFNTGLQTSVTDPNNQTTSYTYDNMMRLTQTNLPDTGQVTFAYTNSAPFEVTITQKITSSMNAVSEGEVDGLGRLKQSRLLSDPQGTVYTDTTYDNAGRKATVSNPYRTTSDGLTRFCYDALGRVRAVTPPDGTPPLADCSGGSNLVLTDYSGNMTTVTDQAGKQRRSWTDALGRLIQVNEPNPTLATPAWTQYTYDTLDNLTSVVQSSSRQRTFTYNSLSQLLSAYNPESGTINYTYDNDGNLLTKTDARGIMTCYGILQSGNCPVGSGYDALHRLTNKNYSDGTPFETFLYDVNSMWGLPLSNTVGRLVRAVGAGNAAQKVFSYDPMGRQDFQMECLPSNCGVSAYWTVLHYDLAGNVKDITYPSGRKVTFGYNTAAQLTRATFDSWNGQAVNYNYLNNATYAPHGAPSSFPLGNGITETSGYNNRLQPAQLSAASSILTAFNFSYNFNQGVANNGNVMAINDQLNAGRTQSFTYDELNRIKTAQSAATAGADCWGLQFGYDVWANLLAASTTKCSPPNLALTINAQNRIADPGYTYDAAGNLTAEPGMSYQYDAENRMKSLNTTGATYTYDASGNRVRKQVGSDSTEYIYFGGQTIAERAANGDWSDYIYAGGRRLARADSYDDSIRIWGTRCSDCGYAYWDALFAGAAGLDGYAIRTGDKLHWRQWQEIGRRGGIVLIFSDGSVACWNAWDQDGQLINDDAIQQTWHYRRVDLTPFAGKIVTQIRLRIETDSAPGSGSIYFQDIALTRTDGTMHPIYTRQKTLNIGVVTGAGFTGTGYEVYHYPASGAYPSISTTYFHGDHLGSSRVMSSYDGYPVWQATYLPFGQEWNPQSTVNHYKFTGKERDAESGLDYFIARYYSSAQGRFLSPDEFTGGPVDAFSSSDPLPPGPLSYADITDPQSLNKYTYTFNNPLRYVDPDGHDGFDFVMGVINAVGSNGIGAGRQESYNADHAAGQAVGDVVSVGIGFVEMAVGSSAAGGGAAACGTGVGCLAGAPVAAAGVTVAAHGVGMAANGIISLAKNTPNPFGMKGAPDHQAKVEELNGKAKGEAKSGQTVESNKQIKGHESKRKPDVQIVDAKGRTRKVFEAERHPNRARNIAREKEYKKLRIPNETHPVH